MELIFGHEMHLYEKVHGRVYTAPDFGMYVVFCMCYVYGIRDGHLTSDST